MEKTIKVADVVFREDLYPRAKHDPGTVQKYAEDLSVLPPIEVNQNMELIDGRHRHTAYRKNGEDEIPAIITETRSDAHLLELAIERNASHGLQLSQQDKKDMARRIYNATNESERDAKKAELASILSVSERTVRGWLSRIDKDAKENQKRKLQELFLANHTQEEAAAAVGCSRESVKRHFGQFGNLAEMTKSDQHAAMHEDGFEPPIYNIWKQQAKSNEVGHFGNSEVRWVDNLLYLYTAPFDVVVDPFGGGGSTIDICKKRLRRYFVSDRKPIVEREQEIRKHDIGEGLPPVHNWKDVSLVYLDPPYWIQAENQYSEDQEDLGNMSLEDFNTALASTIKSFAKKLSKSRPDNAAHIALIIQPTQWKAPGRQFVDHVGDMLRMVDLPVAMRISAPYESQQCNAQMVEWAKDNRECLVLTREIVVWRTK